MQNKTNNYKKEILNYNKQLIKPRVKLTLINY